MEAEKLRMNKKGILNQIGIIRYQLEKLEENINTKSNWYLNKGYDEVKLEKVLYEVIEGLGDI